MDILMRLGDECAELGGLADELQRVMSQALLALANDPDCHRNAQQLDLLSQRLNAVAAYIATLVELVPPSWQLDANPALNHVSLSALAWRLHGLDLPESSHVSGDVDMF